MICLPYHLEGVLETCTGICLPVVLDISGWFHDQQDGRSFSLLTFPAANWFGVPVPPDTAAKMVQVMVKHHNSRLLDSGLQVVDLKVFLSAFNEGDHDHKVYSRERDDDLLFEDVYLGEPYPGGYEKACQDSDNLLRQHGKCRIIDGWHVWDEACS
ncbi:MAG TPA: hypothetical protein DCW68_07270 [Rhodospirillaceae bacterium]|nr:MAG: hypothetical protein A2018_06775 [Alphaproteobacteria bacterium GWF2_58_20]HAU29886.1 hypothetical protein [Rhodospirillaceae bacterium]